MPRRNNEPDDPIAALETDEFGHLPDDTPNLVAAEWYANSGRESEAVLALIREMNGGNTPGEAARIAVQGDDETEG